MALTKFDLVNTDGLKGLNYRGDNIPFDQITDELAEELEGKTHVLKRKSPKAAAKAQAALTAGEAGESTKS
jgi:hypothetical protein